mmetsp:Transcript_6174/g.23345  ORF Transcript_6174/g.23345 Transcript_6174/m.23345 type:complete len:95 (+) Transcript_6174:2928-3212(+)
MSMNRSAEEAEIVVRATSSFVRSTKSSEGVRANAGSTTRKATTRAMMTDRIVIRIGAEHMKQHPQQVKRYRSETEHVSDSTANETTTASVTRTW